MNTHTANTANSPAALIRLQDICFAYPGGKVVLDHLDFTLRKGDRIGLVAPNGSGKTTLFHIIMGLIRPDTGHIEIFGRAVKEEKDFVAVRQRIGMLFQDADDQLFSPTVLEDVAFGPLNMGKSKDEAIAVSRRVLARLGLEAFENRITYKLSGGEKRLVALATVLSMEPEVLLLDEPTSGLDERTKQRLKDILRTLDLSYVLISHEFDFMADTVTSFYTLRDGKIVPDSDLHHHEHAHSHPLGRQPHDHP
jgi:cobalt/nickel transport system ATP-binding protein